MNKKKKGFTIIELLAAIVIVGIIATLATLAIGRYINQGHDAVDSQLEKQLVLSAKSYYSDNKSKFITQDENGVVLWYTTLKSENYMANDLLDSNGNSCGKSYVVVKNNDYSACVVCDNDGYSNTNGKAECTDSLKNHIDCEWRDSTGKKLSNNDKIYVGVTKNNEVSLNLYCGGKNIKFRDVDTDKEVKITKLIPNTMFTVSKGTVGISDDFVASRSGADNQLRSFTQTINYKADSSVKDVEKVSISFKSAAYVENNGVRIPNDVTTYDGIVIDGKGPSCTLSGPYKNSNKTPVTSVKDGSVVYYELKCEDKDSGLESGITADTLKSGFNSNITGVSNLVITDFKNSGNVVSALVNVTVKNPNLNKDKKTFNLDLEFKANTVYDKMNNGNDKAGSKINGKSTTLVIDDQGPTCVFNGPSADVFYTRRKSYFDIKDDTVDVAYYELRCTDETGINPDTFRFSDIKNNGFSKIDQSGLRQQIMLGDQVIGYKYDIMVYEQSSEGVKANLSYDATNVKDILGNSGDKTITSDSITMIDGGKTPTCSISVSYQDGYAVLTGTMRDDDQLSGYGWSNDYGEIDDYESISGTSYTTKFNAYSNDVYYLHVKNKYGLLGYCMSEYVNMPTPDTPILTASDGKSSGEWHNANFTLSASGVSGSVKYYYGTSPYNINSTSRPSVSSETSGDTHYAKACWSNNSNLCSSSAQYLAKLDKTPPVCTVKKTKYGNVCPDDARGTSYAYNRWTQCGVTVELSNCRDSLSGLSSSSSTSSSKNYYSEKEHTVSFTEIKDKAGNSFNDGDNKIKIDRTPPKITWSVKDGATLYVGDTVTVTCSDSASGVAGFGGIFINNSTTDYGTDIVLGVSKKVTFKTDGTKKMYAACSDNAGNPTYEDKAGSNAEITVTVKKKTYTKTTSTMEYFWSSTSSGSGYCSNTINCCSSSSGRVCSASTHNNKYYESCTSYSKVVDKTPQYGFVANKTDGNCNAGVNCCSTSSSRSCSSSSDVGNTKFFSCTKNGSNYKYGTRKVCEVTGYKEVKETAYKYGKSYECLKKSSPTVVTKTGQDSCTAGTETKSNGDNGTLIVTTTCKLE